MAEIVASGYGWTLDSDGALDIFGEGEMIQYFPQYLSWNQYKADITSVTIRGGTTSIGENAFHGYTNLKTVTMGDNVTTIRRYAFLSCSGLTTLTMSDNVRSIQESAFSWCSSLRAVRIPDGLGMIDKYAFNGCASLTEITLPASVSNICEGAFMGCSGLTDITFLYAYPASSGWYSNFSIGKRAFMNCSSLRNIKIPFSVSEIPESAFSGCSALRRVEFAGPDLHRITIKSYAFAYCTSLEEITLPAKVDSVESRAFYECGLTDITIENSALQIGYSAFAYCDKLKNLSFPDGMTSIAGNYAFSYCENLSHIAFPASLTEIQSDVFVSCGNILSVDYPGFEYDWNSVSIGYNNGSLSHARICFLPPVLHVGGALDNGRIRGAQFAFAPGEYVELSYVQSASMDGNEVQSDELYAELRVAGNPETWLSGWEGVSRTVPVWFTRYGKIDGHDTVSVIERREKYYFKSLERVARQNFLLTAQSPIGRLTSDFPGGMYDGEPLYAILSAVVGDVPKTIDYRLNNIGVYGWAPYQSQRETLHMLALACGFVIRRDWKYDLYFTLPDTGAEGLPDEVIFDGGAVDYRIGTAYAGAEISEYTFLRTPNDKEVTLFDNTDGSGVADGLTVVFPDAPVYGLTASEGLTVDWADVNAAVVSGVGVLTGRAYTVVTGMTYLSAENDADPEQILSIRDIPLITNLNSETVARKLLSSANAPVVEMDFLRQHQRPGDLLSFDDPYGAPRTGYLLSLSGSVTSLERVTGTFLSGYVPAWGNTYNNVTILTGFGEWTVPDSLDGATVRVILIGGGTGGASGQRGSDDTASGCGHGTPGDGGKVCVVRLTVHAGESYGYRCGAGGLGGEPSADYDTDEDKKTYRNNPGTAGGASLFGDYSSASGAASAVGYGDMIDGTQYAVPGPDNGVDGGGATTGRENNDRNNPAYTDTEFPTLALPWDETQTWTSGNPGAGKFANQNGGEFQEWAYGGLGGGAAVGSDGGDGAEASNTYTGGAGGKGADALPVFPEDTRAYGSGGSGGHGGGEGGFGGSGNTTESGGFKVHGARGAGGSGSRGQDGKAGCILIYYHG